MFEIGNRQLVGSASRREVFRGALNAVNREGAQAIMPVVKPASLYELGTPPAPPQGAASEHRSLLNCILNLSKLLAEDAGNKLSPQQIDYAQTIYAAGTQLLCYVDRKILGDLTDAETYHGLRSRRSDDGRLLSAESDASSPGQRRSVPELAGKKVLIVDDDVLNIYTMTCALEQQGMIVMHADNGQAGLEMLRAQVDMDAVIMSSRMQTRSNHELIGCIRGMPPFKTIPIIAVIPDGDRDKCVGFGASDYVDKPINVEQLLSLMRAWLTRAE